MQTKYNTVRPVQVTPGPFQAHKLHCRVEQLRSIAASSTRTTLAHLILPRSDDQRHERRRSPPRPVRY
jgi:hypothetical protein